MRQGQLSKKIYAISFRLLEPYSCKSCGPRVEYNIKLFIKNCLFFFEMRAKLNVK